MKKRTLWIVSLLLILTGCAREAPTAPSGAPIRAALAVQPDPVRAQQPAVFSVTVTQDGQPVDDAEDVKFEIWQDGDASHVILNAASKGFGVYTAEKSFAKPGTYKVMYHVTAREFHSMNVRTFTVEPAPGT